MRGRSLWKWRESPADWKRFIERRGAHREQRRYYLARRTPAERRLSKQLRELRPTIGLKFRERHPILGRYFADFYHSSGVVIEIVRVPPGTEQDERNTARRRDLSDAGFVVLEIAEKDILRRTRRVINAIVEVLDSRRKANGDFRRHPNRPRKLARASSASGRAESGAGEAPEQARATPDEAPPHHALPAFHTCFHCHKAFAIAAEYISHARVCGLQRHRQARTAASAEPPHGGSAEPLVELCDTRGDSEQAPEGDSEQADAHVREYRSVIRVCGGCKGVMSKENLMAHWPYCARTKLRALADRVRGPRPEAERPAFPPELATGPKRWLRKSPRTLVGHLLTLDSGLVVWRPDEASR